MRILGDEEEAPLQGVCCGVGSGPEQIHCSVKKVVIMIVEVVSVSVLNKQDRRKQALDFCLLKLAR